MRINIYYSDLQIFPCLAEVLTHHKKYEVVQYCKNFMVVEWPEASVGVGGMKLQNTEFMNPYKQAERLAAGKGVVYC